MKDLAIALAFLLLAGCGTSLKVVKPDADTGYFTGGSHYKAGKAPVVVDENVDFSKYENLLVVTAGDFVRDNMRNTDYFEEIIDFEELQKRVIREGLDSEINDIRGLIGMKRVAEKMGPFLWLRYDNRQDGRKKFAQLKATDPLTAEEVFVTEIELDYVWKGVNDQNTFYPLLNSFVDWIRENRQ